jgi:hypothetical protein
MSEGQEQKDVQKEQPIAQDDANVDYKALYLDEVQNAKKLRKRAQESELKNQEYTKAQETQKVKQLKEQEKFQELSENLQKQLDEVTPYKEKWESFESSRKESLLSKLPEEDRESLQTESLKTLEYIVSKLEDSKPANPQHTPGRPRNVTDLPTGNKFESMDKNAIKDNWGAILDSYKKKN